MKDRKASERSSSGRAGNRKTARNPEQKEFRGARRDESRRNAKGDTHSTEPKKKFSSRTDARKKSFDRGGFKKFDNQESNFKDKTAGSSGRFKKFDSGDKPEFKNRDTEQRRFRSDDKPQFRDRDGEQRRFRSDDKPQYRERDGKQRRSRSGDKPQFRDRDGEQRRFRSDEKPRNAGPERGRFKSDQKSSDYDPKRKAYKKFDSKNEDDFRAGKKPFSPEKGAGFKNFGEKPVSPERNSGPGFAKKRNFNEEKIKDSLNRKTGEKNPAFIKNTEESEIRLNRYLANAGLCSRREADELIASGVIKVNGEVITEMGFMVKPSDTVKYGKQILSRERLIYVLLNKPKDFITTLDDPEERKTVMELVAGACKERIYPVGRLDRNTTGLLLLTNDGELTAKLTHPSSNIKKIYQAELDKPMALEDFETLKEGVTLEDGYIKPDDLGIVTPDAQVIGIKIHSGKNRVVRRIFEHLGYEVTKLDRTTFAELTKKDLPRGNWRFLTEKEIIRLKYMI